ncbi:NACHT domain-containing NTPase [Chitinophaga sp. CF418]|uniref:NACHT domain-containing protein n=1 Tax=Chitinophaga sp. CF418 TaxID=1855287 RepID=UPI000911422B|nr:hypothetical protein [Chitinophaga sp. CF418]SHM75606.1 hypothetical protein SAMN05216311_103163 [Chitinophaga sp. CF418]
MIPVLPWQNITDKIFEYLSLEVADEQMPGAGFSLYLKPGQAQEGIDIKSAIGKDGKYVCLQSKHVQKLTTTLLNKIVELFLAKEFASMTSKFILATAADLQDTKLQKHLRKMEKDLLEKHSIIFEQWDIYSMETLLKKQYSVVKYYFGQSSADNHCYHQLNYPSIPERQPEQKYIPRKITAYLDDGGSRLLPWMSDGKEGLQMVSLFGGERRFQQQKICLLADAHKGKSVLLREVAHRLEHIEVSFTSLFIELKWQNIRPIDEILTSEYDGWQKIPAKDLVVFIDGLDEAPTDSFRDAVKYIRAFSRENPRTSIVFSCRKVFFHSYGVKEFIGDFDLYELGSLKGANISAFLQTQLLGRYERFMQFVRNANIEFLLQEPFYLITLIAQFKTSNNKNPHTKIGILQKVVEDSFKHSDWRELSNGKTLRQQSVQAMETIERFAFALQLMGTNSLDNEQRQKLFSPIERELLEHSSLIAAHNEKWSLTNSIFQEHLAAMVLAKFTFEKIVSIIAVGTKRKKIKTKWIQTISSLLFILEDQHLSDQILKLIEDDNIELIFLTEPTRYAPAQKVDILNRLIARLEKYRIRPMIIDERTIASFIQNNRQAIQRLLAVIGENYSEVLKISCVRILANLTIANDQQHVLYNLAQGELQQRTNTYYSGQLMELLAINKLGDESFIESLIANDQLNIYHEYRDGIYQLIVMLGLSEKYCSYVLDGMPALIRYNASIKRLGSEHWFEEALLQIKAPQNFRLLFKAFLSEQWLEFYQYADKKKVVLRKIFSNAATVFESDPSIIFPVIAFTKAIGRKYLREEFAEVDVFFEKTKSFPLAVRFLIDDIIADRDWELGALVTEESFDYILYEVEQKEASTGVLRSIASALNYRKKESLARKFISQVDDAYGGVFTKIDPTVLSYMELENKRRENDMFYIQSEENFKIGLNRYFEAYGKKSIPLNDLYVDESSKLDRQKFDSIFVDRLLTSWIRSKKSVNYGQTIKFVENKVKFDRFRVEEIMAYNQKFKEDFPVLEQIVQAYYNEGLASARFANCRWDGTNEEGHIVQTFLWKENLLGKIYLKYQFPTPKEHLMSMVWLDTAGIQSLEPSYFNNSKTLSLLILEELSDMDKEIFADRVLQNIRTGILSTSVLASHFALCKHLHIYDACSLILEMLQQERHEGIGIIQLTDVYLALEGDPGELLGIFNKMTEYNYEFMHYVSFLIESHPEEVKTALLRCINDVGTDEKTKLTAAKYLCSIGESLGFTYLTDYMRIHGRAPFAIQGAIKISAVETSFALDQMSDLVHILAEPESRMVRFPESSTNILIEWLYQFAEKSEHDLDLVVDFFEAKQREFQDTYPLHHNLFWYAFRAIENFRKVEEQTKTIREISALMSESH